MRGHHARTWEIDYDYDYKNCAVPYLEYIIIIAYPI